MYFKQFYLGCLAHASYLIGSNGEAVVVDPQRDVEQYIEEAAALGLKITHVLETHLHADFVSGHRELADRTGAEIIFGEKAYASFPHRAVKDGDEVKIGGICLRILETPGHTPEGICVLVDDPMELDAPMKLLTGDTLFIGDVGRPDLAGSKGYTANEMAGMLYDSLHTKLLTLADSVEVYPAHGAGSMCGRNISKDTSSTIGAQRQFNYALQPMSKEAFVSMMTTDLPEAPAYFTKDAELNRTGAKALVGSTRPAALAAAEVRGKSEADAIVLDVRPSAQFGNGHVPGSLNIGLSGQFASWAGSLLDMTTPIVIVAEDTEGVDEAVMRLARVGIETVIGYLQGGMYAWDKAGYAVATVAQMPIDELNHRLEDGGDLKLLDVRRPGEFNAGHVAQAENAELAHLGELTANMDRRGHIAVMCQSGYRSAAACSVLQKRGFTNVSNVVGGMSAWSALQAKSAEGATAVEAHA
jgi:glyoxylase-like metal-dependent hydrolase (beta-lactamase superfamily II)/rhodanese-related sulfurtransferase